VPPAAWQGPDIKNPKPETVRLISFTARGNYRTDVALAEVAATARRRQFTSAERTRILNAADACRAPGQIGALLRREGIYSSLLATWRKQRSLAQRSALESQKRGPKADPLLLQKQGMAQLTRDNERLRRQLAQAHTIIDVQKKVSSLLGLLMDEKPQGSS